MTILDTNVVSEVMRPAPDPGVLTWIRSLPRDEIWTSSVVVAELLSGIDFMPNGGKQQALRDAVEGMIAEDFRGQILSFDLNAACYYGQILANSRRTGRPIAEMDAEIAAIAAVHGATLATRNTCDFKHCGIALVNPWQPA